MTAEEAVAYIEDHSWSTTRLGLERTRELLSRLGGPQNTLKFVHVAGSNGKGSVCAMLACILQSAGYRTGLYTSPHLEDFCERIQVDGEPISGEALAAVTQRVRAVAESMSDHPSQFELSTAIALLYFAQKKCDIVVLEVGMGGALDSTNAIDAPEVAVITNIGLEHTEYLGGTIEEIAATKAGIVKPGCDCVCYDGAAEAVAVVHSACGDRGVPFTLADLSQLTRVSAGLDGQTFAWKGARYRLSLLGEHQLRNAALALETVDALRRRGWEIPQGAVERGISCVRWPARLEVLNRDPLFLLDGGHNPQCAQALSACLDSLLPGKKAVFLLGVLADKDYPRIVSLLLPRARAFICVTPDSPRALPAGELEAYLKARGAKAAACESTEDGITAALEAAGETAPVVAFGSLYLAGAVRGAFPARYRSWLRKSRIRARNGLTSGERAEKSRAICRRILSDPAFQRAGTVLLYRAVKGEASLEELLSAPEARGKRLLFPLCAGPGEMLALLPGEDAWETGHYGILEPALERSAVISPEEIDLVICPCTVFDEEGNRMGMGAGYYDRYLPQCRRAAVAAAAFEAQKAPRVPMDRWDRPMDAVFTEAAIYRRGQGKG